MSHKEFVDETGRRWAVWDVRPDAIASQLGHDRQERQSATGDVVVRSSRGALQFVASDLRQGWLAFRSADESKRLSPIPSGWEGMADQDLARLAREAKPFRPIVGTRFEPKTQTL